jgi:hypothetical protein
MVNEKFSNTQKYFQLNHQGITALGRKMLSVLIKPVLSKLMANETKLNFEPESILVGDSNKRELFVDFAYKAYMSSLMLTVRDTFGLKVGKQINQVKVEKFIGTPM